MREKLAYRMRTLVIGTTGQLATELHRAPPRAGVELLPPEKVEVANEGDVLALLERTRPEAVINAAAYTAVDRAETESQRAFAVNADGPRTLARWCSAQGAVLLHVSTDYVFDGTSARPYREEDPTSPLNVYGHSKLAGELAIREGLAQHVVLRTSWVFSAHGNNFVKTMLRLAGERDSLRVVADQHGRPTPASDIARALLLLCETRAAGAELAWGTYHYAGAGATTWHGFAQAIVEQQAEATGKRPEVLGISTAEYPTPARRPSNSVLDTTRFEQTFGFAPEPWARALPSIVQQLLGG